MTELLRLIDDADAGQLPVLIEEWSRVPVLRWIARAVRLDLALLVARPALVVPCVYRRCASFGDDGSYGLRLDTPGDAAELRDRLRGDELPIRGPWLRSLQPPPVPIDAGAVEEYRSAAPGDLAITGELVGIAGAIAWDRATGHRVAPPAAVAVPSWRIVRDELVGPAASFPLAVEDARRAFAVSGGGVLVACEGYDDVPQLALCDAATGRIRWTRAGSAHVAVPYDDTRFAVAGDAGIALHQLSDGEVTHAWPAPHASAIAVAPDGAVATRSGSVIRVWDVAEADAAKLTLVRGGDGVAPQWSPDGARLLAGDRLYDGRDGRVVASRLGLRSSGWLEGGPPPDFIRLMTGLLVEITPFGTRMWSSATGSPISDERQPAARHDDAVAFDPGGRWLAIARRRRDVEVHDLRTREVRRLAGGEPLPAEPTAREVPVVDGVVDFGGAALPVDDGPAIVSPDGNYLATRTSHLALLT